MERVQVRLYVSKGMDMAGMINTLMMDTRTDRNIRVVAANNTIYTANDELDIPYIAIIGTKDYDGELRTTEYYEGATKAVLDLFVDDDMDEDDILRLHGEVREANGKEYMFNLRTVSPLG